MEPQLVTISTVNSISSSLSGINNDYDAGTLTAITALLQMDQVLMHFNFTFAGGAGASGVTAATAAAGGSGYAIGDTHVTLLLN